MILFDERPTDGRPTEGGGGETTEAARTRTPEGRECQLLRAATPVERRRELLAVSTRVYAALIVAPRPITVGLGSLAEEAIQLADHLIRMVNLEITEDADEDHCEDLSVEAEIDPQKIADSFNRAALEDDTLTRESVDLTISLPDPDDGD